MTQLQHPGQVVSNQISFTLSEQEYVKALLLNSKGKQMGMIAAILAIIGCGMAAIASLSGALGIMLIFAAYLTLIIVMMRQLVRQQYRSMPQLHGVQTVQFSQDGLVWHNDYALSRIKWPLYQKFAANENVYLLYQAPHMFNMIPRSAFVDAEQEAAFRALLELHVKPAGKTSARRGREV